MGKTRPRDAGKGGSMKPRIHKDELQRIVRDQVIILAASRGLGSEDARGKSVYSLSSDITDSVVRALLRDYVVIRKSRTQRTV